MLYLAIGAGLFWLLFMNKGTRKLLRHQEWRIASAFLAVISFAVAGYLGLRGGWVGSVMLTVIGLWLAASARTPRVASARPSREAGRIAEMTVAEAYEVLDLKPGASREDVQQAYLRLMKLVHPDRGGGAWMAQQLNMARDLLLK